MTLTRQLLAMAGIAVLLGLGSRVMQKEPVPFWGFPKPVELIQPKAAIAAVGTVSPDSAFVPADKPYEADLSTTMGLYMKRKKTNVHFIDARLPELYNAGHIPGAVNIPVAKLDDYQKALSEIPKTDLILAYCEGTECHDSHDLAERLIAEGWNRIAVFAGGWAEWSAETDFVETAQ